MRACRSYRSNKIVIQSASYNFNLHRAYIDGIEPPQVIEVLLIPPMLAKG
jgi:hypothetical protein